MHDFDKSKEYSRNSSRRNYVMQWPPDLLQIQVVKSWYCTIIEFNDVDVRIFLTEKRDIHRGHKAEVIITFKGK